MSNYYNREILIDQQVEIEKLKDERDALAAQVEALHQTLGKALDLAETGAANNWYAEGEDICWIDSQLKEHAKGIPDAQHLLRELRAEAGLGGWMACERWFYCDDSLPDECLKAANQYAEQIRRGEVE